MYRNNNYEENEQVLFKLLIKLEKTQKVTFKNQKNV